MKKYIILISILLILAGLLTILEIRSGNYNLGNGENNTPVKEQIMKKSDLDSSLTLDEAVKVDDNVDDSGKDKEVYKSSGSEIKNELKAKLKKSSGDRYIHFTEHDNIVNPHGY